MKTFVLIGILTLSIVEAPHVKRWIKHKFPVEKKYLTNKGVTKNDIKSYIRYKCFEYCLKYKLIIALIKTESNFNLYCREWKKGKTISYGLFQNSLATASWYREEKNIKINICQIKWIFNWKNNIDVALWNIGTRYKYFYDAYRHRYSHNYTRILAHKIAFSCHNMGEAGRMKYKKKYGWLYYPRYIRAIEKKLGRKF